METLKETVDAMVDLGLLDLGYKCVARFPLVCFFRHFFSISSFPPCPLPAMTTLRRGWASPPPPPRL